MNRTARRSRLGSGGLPGSPRSLHRLSARWMRFGADWLPQRHFGLYADILPARRKNVNRVCAISAFFLTQPASDLRRRRVACQKTFFDTLSDRKNVRKTSNSRPSAYIGTTGRELRSTRKGHAASAAHQKPCAASKKRLNFVSLRGRSAAVAILKLKVWHPVAKHGST